MNAYRNMEIVERAYDKKFIVWAEIDNPECDRDWYLKNGLGVPQLWIAIAVTHTRDAAVRAIKQQRGQA
jgi:hypothetical protein